MCPRPAWWVLALSSLVGADAVCVRQYDDYDVWVRACVRMCERVEAAAAAEAAAVAHHHLHTHTQKVYFSELIT